MARAQARRSAEAREAASKPGVPSPATRTCIVATKKLPSWVAAPLGNVYLPYKSGFRVEIGYVDSGKG